MSRTLPRKPIIGGIYAFQGWFGGPWGAYQVCTPRPSSEADFGWVALDWSGNSLAAAREIVPLPHAHMGRSTDQQVPMGHHHIRTEAPLVDVPTTNVGYSGFPHEPAWLLPQKRRNRLSDAEVVRKANEGGFAFMYRGRKATFDPQAKHHDWSILKATPQLTDFVMTGPPQDFFDTMDALSLAALSLHKHDQSVLDLTEKSLVRVGADVQGLKQLKLPSSIEQLVLYGPRDDNDGACAIAHDGMGHRLHLTLQNLDFQLPVISGLAELSSLTINHGAVDLAFVASSFPALVSLAIRGGPTVLKNADALQRFPKLRRLLLVDCFGIGGDDLPTRSSSPLLDDIHLSSIPADVARQARKRRSEFGRFHVAQARNADWLERNLENPFRSWDGRSGVTPKGSKKAKDAYARALRAIAKIKKNNAVPDHGESLQILTDFLMAFAKMKSSLATLEREEVADVVHSLSQKLSLALKEAMSKRRSLKSSTSDLTTAQARWITLLRRPAKQNPTLADLRRHS
ncbi:hypothetical protein [Cognatiyoonia sp. IB215182]|uniref:hypothetical protein n=1 Tax=Cognatiyoonia sp. IB215182 TaxID=3097353 RepID=UPI002A16DB31|nr:hypothetical protein [Cognatiyoonia sp. IB215182]MDX8354379.1 hypothetical protein [Cognatiyoonia sp. IB215182]